MAHELDDRMRAVEIGQATLVTTVEANTQMVGHLLTKHDEAIYGDVGEPGIITRLDREEQNTKTTKRTIWLAGSALIGIGAKFGYDLIQHLLEH